MAFRLLKPDRNKVKMFLKEPRPKIDITVPFSVEVLANPSMVNLKNEKNQRKLKQKLTDLLTSRMEEVMTKAQTE